MASIVIATAGLVMHEARLADPATSVVARLDDVAVTLGLVIDQVEITGHGATSATAILDAADLTQTRSLVGLDTVAIIDRIERLPWVDRVSLSTVPPHRLRIQITERRAFAVWERATTDTLVDATGRELAIVGRGTAPDLPRIAGPQAPDDAARLLDLVEGFPDLAGRLLKAERIAGRRWRLFLRAGPVVELPAEADATALAMLVEVRGGRRLIDLDARVIDMTVLRRITIRRPASQPRG